MLSVNYILLPSLLPLQTANCINSISHIASSLSFMKPANLDLDQAGQSHSDESLSSRTTPEFYLSSPDRASNGTSASRRSSYGPSFIFNIDGAPFDGDAIPTSGSVSSVPASMSFASSSTDCNPPPVIGHRNSRHNTTIFNAAQNSNSYTSSYITTSTIHTNTPSNEQTSTMTTTTTSPLITNDASLPSSTSQSTSTATATAPSQIRRGGIETCIIRRDEIPSFQIPHRRPSLAKITSNSICPRLYLQNKNNPLLFPSCAGRCWSQKVMARSSLRHSKSSSSMVYRKHFGQGSPSNIMNSDETSTGFNMGSSNRIRHCSEKCLRHFYTQSAVSSFDNFAVLESSLSRARSEGNTNAANQRTALCCCDVLGCVTSSKLMRAHKTLTQMKEDFKLLEDKNFLSRYKKMKNIIKKCMDVDL